MDTTFLHVLPPSLQTFSYVMGLESLGLGSGLNIIPNGDWHPFVPTNEDQSGGQGKDKLICCTEANHQGYETDLMAEIAFGRVPQTHIDWLRQHGYFDANGKINFSERYSAILNGTTEKGNSLEVVAGSVRKYGLIPEAMFPNDVSLTWADYFDRTKVTKDMLDLGQQFLQYFNPYNQWVWTGGGNRTPQQNAIMRQAMLVAPLQIAAPVCYGWNTGTVNSCGVVNTQHSTLILELLFDNRAQILDHYLPYNKTLAADYPIPYAMQVYVRPNDLSVFRHNFTVDLKFGTSSTEVVALQQALFKSKLFYDSSLNSLENIKTYGGYFGSVTLAAVKAFQARNKLPTTGFVGPQTRAALNVLFNS